MTSTYSMLSRLFFKAVTKVTEAEYFIIYNEE